MKDSYTWLENSLFEVIIMKYDVIIIGGGPAGLTAGIYACRSGWKTVLIERGAPGGQATTTEIIENYPGFPEGISGPELMSKFYSQAARFGCEFMTTDVKSISYNGTKKIIETNQGTIEGKTLIVATGSQPRELGVEGEKKFRGRGVSYCATCDGFFFRDKKVAVVGGGDAAVKEAMYLANLAAQVVIIHRRDKFRAAKVLGDKAIQNPKIKVMWDSVVDEIVGDNSLNGVRIRNVKTNDEQMLEADGVFMYVGTKPNTEFVGTDIKKNPQGYIITDESLSTNIKGVYAIGDCRLKGSRQVATAVGDGALVMPALEDYLHAL